MENEVFKLDRERVIADADYRKEMRFVCQTDHIILAHILGYTLINLQDHGPAIALFPKKDPTQPFKEQLRGHRSLELDPRGTFKSTLKIVEAVQKIICWPEIRIFKFTATVPLATAFVDEIGDHFVCADVPKDLATAYEDEDFCSTASDFQLLFPEFLITPSARKVGSYTAPCRKVVTKIKEKTVMAWSNEKTISGWHCDDADVDDIVDTVNSGTPTSTKKVKKNWNTNKKTCMPWASIEYSGTRYGPFEQWGDLLDKAAARDKKGDKYGGKLKILVRGALTVKNGKRLEADRFPEPEEIVLNFPNLLSYDFLKDEFEDDFESFMTQYMNDAHGANEVIFPRDLLEKRMIAEDDVPVTGQLFMCGHFAVKGEPSMKNVGFAVGMMNAGKMIVTDLLRGTFAPSRMAHKLVEMAKKHGVRRIVIAETPGARKLEATITDYAQVMNHAVAVQWVELPDESGRDIRIKHAEPLLQQGRLLFSEGAASLSELVKQYANYGMIEETEIPSAISFLIDNLPASVVVTQADAELEASWQQSIDRDLHDRTYGLGRYAAADEPAIPESEKSNTPPSNSLGLEDIMPGLNG